MARGLIGSVLLVVAGIQAAAVSSPAAATHPAVLQRFFAIDDRAPAQYRALRRLEAYNAQFDASAWMEVWTEADEAGFRYDIAAEEGSDYIRSKVFLKTLETERRMWASRGADRGAISPDNYVFEDRGAEPAGLAQVGVKPRRKDMLLVDGSIFLRPEDGDLVRIQGLLSKTPSFWTRRVQIVRRYERVAGVRVPVAMESVANVLVAGKSTFAMTYQYETVNGQRVGDPIVRASSR